MERSTAMALFESFERERMTDLPGDPPVYDVRVDALTAPNEEPGDQRYYRVRVTAARGMGGTDRDEWLYVLEQAGEHDVHVDVANNGVELY